MPSLSSSSPPDRMNFSRKARSFLPVAVLGFHSEAGWRASFSETAARMNPLRLTSGMRLRSDNGIFTVTACNVRVIPKMYYPLRLFASIPLPATGQPPRLLLQFGAPPSEHLERPDDAATSSPNGRSASLSPALDRRGAKGRRSYAGKTPVNDPQP